MKDEGFLPANSDLTSVASMDPFPLVWANFASLPRETGCPGVPRRWLQLQSSCEDISCRVHVSMCFVSTTQTMECLLIRPVAGIHMSASGTRLRGIGRIHQEQHATGPLELITQHSLQLSPPLVENGFVQSGFLPDIASGCLDRSLCGTGHIHHLQVFQHDHRVVFADDRADLMQDGFTHFRDPLMQSRDFRFLKFPVGGKFPFTRQFSLFSGQFPLQVPIGCHRQKHSSIGQGEQIGYSSVTTDRRGGGMHGIHHVLFCLNGSIPVSACSTDGDIADFSADDAGFAEFHPSDFRQEDLGKHLAPILVQRVQIEMNVIGIGITKTVVREFLFEPGKFLGGGLIEGVLERAREMLQRLLLGRR